MAIRPADVKTREAERARAVRTNLAIFTTSILAVAGVCYLNTLAIVYQFWISLGALVIAGLLWRIPYNNQIRLVLMALSSLTALQFIAWRFGYTLVSSNLFNSIA